MYCKECDFVYNLAGVNRPKDNSEFMKGNFGFASTLLETLKKHGNNCPIMISSSIQAKLDNDYGKSKKAGEDLIFEYGKETGAKTYVYRFPNLFGKWCKPNYNSVIATFCYNIANDLEIKVNDPTVELTLSYIDDVVDELINAAKGQANIDSEGFALVSIQHKVKLGDIASALYSFKEMDKDLSVPDNSNGFIKKLYATYLSYLPKDKFSYELKMNEDYRGSFTEIIRMVDRGQFSVNVSKPHIVKGNHWHHTKNEKFLVVKGKGVIRFRKIDEDEVIEYFVSDEKL